MKTSFYSNEKLLNSVDITGEKPELYIVCSRVRGPGKTFSFTSKLIDDFIETGGKFILLCRHKQEFGPIADGMMKAMLAVRYPGSWVYEKVQGKGQYSKVFLHRKVDGIETEEHCGYCVAISSADTIKTISSTFTDAIQGYFDEFQPEHDSTYIRDEVTKFLSLHVTFARGVGESRRHFPIYMSSNAISVFNPYFVALDLSPRIQDNTKFVRGDGYVFEKAENAGLAEKHASSGMSRAFKTNQSINFGDNSWLNDNDSCIGKTDGWGRGVYIATLVDADETRYAVKLYPDVGMYYVDTKVDINCKNVYNMSLDGDLNLPYIRTNDIFKLLRKKFLQGQVRVRDGNIKSIIIGLFK